MLRGQEELDSRGRGAQCPRMVSALFCPSCGAPLSQGALACSFCRVALSWPQAPAAPVDSALLQEVTKQLRSRNKILAIKTYQQAKRCGLAEAKQFIDELERKLTTG